VLELNELTQVDRDTLICALRLEHDDSSIFPDGIGQVSHFRKLVRRGLLEFHDWGVDNDNHERQVMLYRLTDRGREEAKRAREAEVVAGG